MKKKSNKPKPRHQARCFAMQALYQWQLNPLPVIEFIACFREDNDLSTADSSYFEELLGGTINHLADIDLVMSPHLDRPIDELNPVELAALRFSVYELKYRLDIPYRVVINEALDVTKQYGSDQGYKYVNAVLDKCIPHLRADELVKNKK